MNDQNSKKVLQLMGLAQKAGRIASGESGCEEALRSKKAYLVLLSQDASAGTKKKFEQKCFYYQVPVMTAECTAAQLGRSLGKGPRSAAAVCDAGLAEGILKIKNVPLETRDRKVDQ